MIAYNNNMDARAERLIELRENQVDRLDLIVMIGELLAAVSDVLEGQAIIRRRGPTRMRRFLSVLLTFMVLAARDAVRCHAVAQKHFRSSIGSFQLRNLHHPPKSWAAP